MLKIGMNKIVKISGGLGNQLFQYSFGRYLEETLKVNVAFDLQTVQNIFKFTSRTPLINNLVPSINILNEPYNRFPLLYRIKRKLVLDYFPNFSEIYVENFPQEQILNLVLANSKRYFDGYWQSLMYVNVIEEKLRLEINFDHNLSKLCSAEFVDITQTNSCSIHIRRGDYLLPHNSKIFAECGMNYFNRAINYIVDNNSDTDFFVFSDDIIWAKKIFIGPKFNFIDKYENNPVIDLFLMSNCKNNIISNSTFSWWASWLNTNNDKIIISPEKWFLNEKLNDILIKNITNSHHILL